LRSLDTVQVDIQLYSTMKADKEVKQAAVVAAAQDDDEPDEW
jgi:hypothetical protein